MATYIEATKLCAYKIMCSYLLYVKHLIVATCMKPAGIIVLFTIC